MTRPEWAVALVPAIRSIDGGCGECIGEFLRMAAEAHPDVDWAGLVWDRCQTCGALVTGRVHDGAAYCADHRPAPPSHPSGLNIGSMTKESWASAVGPSALHLNADYLRVWLK